MFRALLRLLLILTLVANAVAAPSARGAMAHAHRHADPSTGDAADHGQHRGHSHHVALATTTDTASMQMPAHHDHAAMGHASGERPSGPSDDSGSCCDSERCNCGCMLPPMLSVATQVAMAPAWLAPPPHRFATLAASTRHRPPLRPPAG